MRAPQNPSLSGQKRWWHSTWQTEGRRRSTISRPGNLSLQQVLTLPTEGTSALTDSIMLTCWSPLTAIEPMCRPAGSAWWSMPGTGSTWTCSSPASQKSASSRRWASSSASTVPGSRMPATPTRTLMISTALSGAAISWKKDWQTMKIFTLWTCWSPLRLPAKRIWNGRSARWKSCCSPRTCGYPPATSGKNRHSSLPCLLYLWKKDCMNAASAISWLGALQAATPSPAMRCVMTTASF